MNFSTTSNTNNDNKNNATMIAKKLSYAPTFVKNSADDNDNDSAMTCGNNENDEIKKSEQHQEERNYVEEEELWFPIEITLYILDFLDTPSLGSFSLVARRPNLDVYYYLQLKLQHQLLLHTTLSPTTATAKRTNNDNKNTNTSHLITGDDADSSLIALIQMAPTQAQEIVQEEFFDVTSGLKAKTPSNYRPNNYFTLSSKNQERAAAALFLALGGAAYMSSASTAASSTAQMIEDTFMDTVMDQKTVVMFRLGFVLFGSLLGAAKQMHQQQQLQKQQWLNKQQEQQQQEEINASASCDNTNQAASSQGPSSSSSYKNQIKPCGSVGAYRRVLKTASRRVKQIIKQERKSRFVAMPQVQQFQYTLDFLEACSSDTTLHVVQDMVESAMDVDSFFVGRDGTLTCALHAAAMNNAHKVIDYLCRDGYCNVNIQDDNGWSALHYAAASNAVTSVQILVLSHGADIDLENNNGYTAMQWAQRLANQQVMVELRRISQEQMLQKLLSSTSSSTSGGPVSFPSQYWRSKQETLSGIANQIFGMVPSH